MLALIFELVMIFFCCLDIFLYIRPIRNSQFSAANLNWGFILEIYARAIILKQFLSGLVMEKLAKFGFIYPYAAGIFGKV